MGLGVTVSTAAPALQVISVHGLPKKHPLEEGWDCHEVIEAAHWSALWVKVRMVGGLLLLEHSGILPLTARVALDKQADLSGDSTFSPLDVVSKAPIRC